MNENLFEYYVIHLIDAKDRFENIKNMEIKLKNKINIFEAINFKLPNKNINDDIKIYDNNLKLNYKPTYIGEIGCYLSHYLLYKSLLNSNYTYTIIFEDDFNIIDNDINQKITDLLSNVNYDFDYLFLGYNINTNTNYINNNKLKFSNNLHFIEYNKKVWGFHGYIINNKNIPKILNLLNNINCEIDMLVYRLIKKKIINGYFYNPLLVNIKMLPSYIRDKKENIIKKTQIIQKPLGKNNTNDKKRLMIHLLNNR